MTDVSGNVTLPTKLITAELGALYTRYVALAVANSFGCDHRKL